MNNGDFVNVEIWYEVHKFTIKIHVPSDFDHSDTLLYATITISDSIIDTSMPSSSGRVDIMSKKSVIQ